MEGVDPPMEHTALSDRPPAPFAPTYEPPDALEAATGVVVGSRRATLPDVPRDNPAASPQETLERLALPALTRSPCLVAFSGGRDSSVMLAAATKVARREGLDDPIPITMRYADHPRTWETEWQEMMIDHLGLSDWRTLELGSELEAVGPVAQRVLRRHGLYWPANGHVLLPFLEAAKGGSLLTGSGGDESMNAWRGARQYLLTRGRLRPNAKDLKLLAMSGLPKRLQRSLWMHAPGLPRLEWLTAEGQDRLARSWSHPLPPRRDRYARVLERLISSRYLELTLGISFAMAAEVGTRLVQPFADPRFVRAVAAAAPPQGHTSRAEAIRSYFGELLPPQVVVRATKASFTGILWGPEGRALASEWDGAGLDPGLVDAAALKRTWFSGPHPDFRSLTALQAAWLGSNPQA